MSLSVHFILTKRSMDTKINIYILSIFLKVQNFLITLTVMSAPSVSHTWSVDGKRSVAKRRSGRWDLPVWSLTTTIYDRTGGGGSGESHLPGRQVHAH